MKNLTKTVMKAALALALSGAAFGAHAANNVATVKVKNLTAATAVYGYEYFAGTASPTPTNIAANGNITFTVTSAFDTVSGMRFTYTSGTKACRFVASHTVNIVSGAITYTKTGTSIGSTFATCTAAITAASPTSPYNYTVEFSIK